MSRKRISTDRRVKAFADTARRFCKLIESASTFKKREFVNACATILPELQLRAVEMLDISIRPIPEPPSVDPPAIERSVREGLVLRNRLDRKLTRDHGYHLLFDPHELDEPVWTSLGDDLADIYHDLKESLDLFGKGNEEDDREAVWRWGFFYLGHWGHHCAASMRPIHQLVKRDRENSW